MQGERGDTRVILQWNTDLTPDEYKRLILDQPLHHFAPGNPVYLPAARIQDAAIIPKGLPGEVVDIGFKVITVAFIMGKKRHVFNVVYNEVKLIPRG